ncbi:MAG: cupin domain-containing protein [Thermoplasmata archaeon]|nr:MAG: cupin domain-containing protein [Thermoplasmata archaeon]
MEMIDIKDIEKGSDSKPVKKVPILTDQLMATILTIGPNTKIPAHIHPDSDEIHYIVKGTGKITVGNKSITIKEGMLILVPKTESHYFSTSNEQMIVLSNSPVCGPKDQKYMERKKEV